MSQTRVASPVVAPAATVVLVRAVDDGRLEVLLTKRSAGLSFMAGLWVFPGGRMEPCDHSAELIGRVRTPSHIEPLRQRMLDRDGAPVPAELALGLCVAACRETFEESGVLLAGPRTGAPARNLARVGLDPELRDAASTAEGFLRLLVSQDLELEVDRLVYWAHWITPSAETKRFDTRFFVVQAPPGQEASVDRSELTHHAWLDRQAIETHIASGEMRMAPPTLATLQDLWRSHARHGGVERMLGHERTREVPPILPKAVRVNDAVEVVLPWDPGYTAMPGEGAAVLQRYPDYLAALPSRRRFER
jgi:8-oxo-dGTP pyrophosphatase MutT (NUDIX family)